MTEMRTWLYCVGEPVVAGALDGLHGVEEDHPPSARGDDELVAVTSEVPATLYGEGLEERLADLEWLEPRARAHERVVDACFEAGPVIPVRFGTLFPDPADLDSFLAGRRTDLRRILEELAGYEEWGVRAYLDRERFADWLGDGGETGEETDEPSGIAYLRKRKARLEARDRLDDALARTLAELIGTLSGPASERAREPVPGSGELVLKLSLLVDRDAVPDLEAAVEEARETGAERGVTLEATGPWPPYAFVPSLGERTTEEAPS